jgi:hypothetical protein
MVPRSRLVYRLSLLAGLVLAAGGGLGFWAYRAIYLPRHGYTENAILSADNITGFQTIDKVILRIRLRSSGGPELRGNLHIELLDPKGKVLGERDKAISQTEAAADYRVEIPVKAVAAEKVTLQCALGNQKFAVPLARVLAVKAHETTLIADREFVAGTPASLRCGVHAVQSLSGDIPVFTADVRAGNRTKKLTRMHRTPETGPLISAEVSVNLRAKDGTVHALHKGLTGRDGWDQAAFTVPAVPPGAYTLQVVTRSDLGEENLEQAVRVKAPAQVLLATDKAVYQPGQTMHLRALARRSFDHKPLVGAAVAFTVTDGEGKRVFQRSQPTAADGSVAVDCPLPDSTAAGAYRVQAALGDDRAETTIDVRRPARPRFRVKLTTDKAYYLAGEIIHVEAQVDDDAGKPVPGAALTATAAPAADANDQFQTWKGDVDVRGHARWDVKLPGDFGGQALRDGRAEVLLEVKATDLTGRSETVRRALPVSDQPIRVSLIPDGGRLVPELENRVHVAAIYPDGRPAACAVIIRQGKAPQAALLTSVQTSALGLTTFRFTPKKTDFCVGPRQKHVREMLGNRHKVEQVPGLLFDLVVEARDARGVAARNLVTLPGSPSGENILLWSDRTVYRPGDTLNLEVLATAGLTRPYVDLVRDGQRVVTRNLSVPAGRAETQLRLPTGLTGALEVHVYQAVDTGEIFRAARVIYVSPAAADQNAAFWDRAGRPRFRPAAGQPGASSGGAVVVDGSTYPLVELRPGLEKVYATLQGEWPESAPGGAAPPASEVEGAERQDEVAGALLAVVRPRLPRTWIVEPVVQRHYRRYDQARRVAWAVFAYARAGRPFMDFDARTGHWRFRPDLLQEMVKAGALDAALLEGPLGGRLLLEDLARWEENFTVDRVAELATWSRWQRLIELVGKYTADHPEFHQGDRWNLPATVLADAVGRQKQDPLVLQDAWGEATRLVRRSFKLTNKTGLPQFDFHELVSAGPDRTFDTSDDLHCFDPLLRQRVEEPLFGVSLGDYLAGVLEPPEVSANGRARHESP